MLLLCLLFLQNGSAVAAARDRLGTWIPAGRYNRCSLTDLTHLITRANLQAAVHEYAAAGAPVDATAASVVALAAPDGLALHMSGASYRCLMDMVFDNLMHHTSSFQKAAAPLNAAASYQTSFNPGLKFGPKPGQLPSFGITLNSSAVQVTLRVKSHGVWQLVHSGADDIWFPYRHQSTLPVMESAKALMSGLAIVVSCSRLPAQLISALALCNILATQPIGSVPLAQAHCLCIRPYTSTQ